MQHHTVAGVHPNHPSGCGSLLLGFVPGILVARRGRVAGPGAEGFPLTTKTIRIQITIPKKENTDMRRRQFMAASALASLAPLGGIAMAKDPNDSPKKECYELRLYKLASAEKQKAMVDFLGKAAIPALNRIGIKPVGVFKIIEGDSPDLYVLLPHCCLASVATATARLMADQQYLEAGAAVLDAPKSDPAYQRIESSLMVAFDEIPKLEIPSKKQSRVFQLRIYESHNAERALKKIAMFNSGGEIALFRRTGMPPVFFGETLIGTKVPNLTYMLGFDDLDAKEAGWKKFLAHPDWTKLKTDPQYKDTVSNITNIMLRPAACSQV